MINLEALQEIGLSKGEAKVYLCLLRIGEAQVNRIKNETKMHRTTIYDFLDSLIKKGMVSYVIRNNVKFFSASHPSKLADIIKEKQEILDNILPSLMKTAGSEKRDIRVEILDGTEGFKVFANRVLETGKELLGFGIDESKFEDMLKYVMASYFKKEGKLGIKEKMISVKGAKFIYSDKMHEYRYMDKKFFSPIPTMIFGNNIAFIIWEPLTTINIENKDLANTYRKHFELLWKIADKKP